MLLYLDVCVYVLRWVFTYISVDTFIFMCMYIFMGQYTFT